MSSCILYTVGANGEAVPSHEFQNSWGGAALIWDYFTMKYFPAPPGKKQWETGIGMGANLKPVWDLWKRKDLPLAERVVLMSTFDNVMVKKEDLNDLADSFEAVNKDMRHVCENYETRVSHMRSQASVFREIAQDPNALAICWQQTSVAEDMWYVKEYPDNYDDLTEEEQEKIDDVDSVPYNINVHTKHWFLYDELKAQDGETN